ncbi:2-hydroxyacid dehydrogenase [Brucella pituitosa]|uniref:2-hydroxyacid dehydrogenase n=1 Tax=Brucella pituitosa TaxID=571256 RepID=UPI003F4AE2D3
MKQQILQMGPLLPETMSELETTYIVHRYDLVPDKSKLLSRIAPALCAIATRGDYLLGEDIMRSLPNLKLIASSGAGFDGIDAKAAKAQGITVTNTPGVVSECVADLAMALILTTIRKTLVHDRFVRSGEWRHTKPTLTEKVWGERIGIIGLGGIGKAIARRATAFRMPVGYYGRQKQETVDFQYFGDLVKLAHWAKILVVAVPGGSATAGLVSRAVIDALGPTGVLINVSRGSVIDEPYLVDALVTRRLAGAGLDVFADEPNIPERLLELDTVVLQPHIGSGSNYTRIAMGQLLLDNLAAFFANRPLLSPTS